MLNLLKWIFGYNERIGISSDRELSKHRLHTTKYQDLCM